MGPATWSNAWRRRCGPSARGDSFEEGALLAVNLGDDADTTGAVYGQLAGAYYGEGGIPKQWIERSGQDGLLAGPSRSATSVHQPTYEMGRSAAKLLLDIINAQEDLPEPGLVLFDPELRARETA